MRIPLDKRRTGVGSAGGTSDTEVEYGSLVCVASQVENEGQAREDPFASRSGPCKCRLGGDDDICVYNQCEWRWVGNKREDDGY